MFYRRNLPHFQPSGATFFVSFRLDGSLPEEAIRRLREERDEAERRAHNTTNSLDRQNERDRIKQFYFKKYADLLNGTSKGPHWLKEPTIAQVVVEAFQFRDGKVIDLLAYCIMPNHVHAVFSLLDGAAILFKVLQSLKRHAAREANKKLGREGAFWQSESYDHVVRNEREFYQIIEYVLNNPVEAGLAKVWDEWEWSYVKPGVL